MCTTSGPKVNTRLKGNVPLCTGHLQKKDLSPEEKDSLQASKGLRLSQQKLLTAHGGGLGVYTLPECAFILTLPIA